MRRLIITMLVSVLTATLVQAGSAAGGPPCLVSKERSGPPARSLQAGVDAAAAGDTLIVRGTCIGTATITKDLTLRGVSSGPFVATLDGNGVGPVLSVTGTVVVAIDNLLVTNGTTGIAESFGGTLTVSSLRIPPWSCVNVVNPAPWRTVYDELSRAMPGVGDQGAPDPAGR